MSMYNCKNCTIKNNHPNAICYKCGAKQTDMYVLERIQNSIDEDVNYARQCADVATAENERNAQNIRDAFTRNINATSADILAKI